MYPIQISHRAMALTIYYPSYNEELIVSSNFVSINVTLLSSEKNRLKGKLREIYPTKSENFVRLSTKSQKFPFANRPLFFRMREISHRLQSLKQPIDKHFY